MVINHHSFFSQRLPIVDYPQYFELRAKDSKWRTEIASHVDLNVRLFNQMHNHFEEDNDSHYNAIHQLKGCIDFAKDIYMRFLKKPENAVPSSEFTTRVTRTVDRLIMALQLMVINFIPHMQELY